MMTNETWIDWNGGDCPVDGETFVDVELYDTQGNESRFFKVKANEFYWEDRKTHIIAYRVSKGE